MKQGDKSKIIEVYYTAFNKQWRRVFFDKSMEQVVRELNTECNTTIIHETTEYDITIDAKEIKEGVKPFEIPTRHNHPPGK